ncbi:hypothetical protein [Stutzerimonas nitrititolerans]|uniref:hypothetical protein n=1 Tax=Stutzerimonas nitrititolerans TaxID=2482751 RepID=UPI000E00C4BB|nr:hypothetical protein [Stutzerimonas nitrititolerans]SUD82824.1 Uncharacterised protein [Stutzerimonas stutzeri]
MTCHERDQRQYHALREHIDSLLARGASLVGRDPVRLSLEGRTFTVQHGMLVGSEDPQDMLEAFAESPKSQTRHRELVLDICLRQLSEAIETECPEPIPLDQATAQTAERCAPAGARPTSGRTPRDS